MAHETQQRLAGDGGKERLSLNQSFFGDESIRSQQPEEGAGDEKHEGEIETGGIDDEATLETHPPDYRSEEDAGNLGFHGDIGEDKVIMVEWSFPQAGLACSGGNAMVNFAPSLPQPFDQRGGIIEIVVDD